MPTKEQLSTAAHTPRPNPPPGRSAVDDDVRVVVGEHLVRVRVSVRVSVRARVRVRARARARGRLRVRVRCRVRVVVGEHRRARRLRRTDVACRVAPPRSARR